MDCLGYLRCALQPPAGVPSLRSAAPHWGTFAALCSAPLGYLRCALQPPTGVPSLCSAAPHWGTFAAICAPRLGYLRCARCSRMRSRLKILTPRWLCQLGFCFFQTPYKSELLTVSGKNKTPLSFESGVRALSDHDWSRTSTSRGHYPLKVARLPIPPRGLE